jgi:hypothetical protein
LVLGAVLIMMALILASPLQQYLQQRHALSQAEQARATTSARVAVLQAQLAQWSDPHFIEAQARARLQLARPGDTVYVVVGAGHTKSDPSTQQNVPVTTTAGPTSWQTRAWTTLQVADAAQ